jgi:hypothetical protein
MRILGRDGVVTAIDITHNPENGCDAKKLADAWVESQDDRIKYIIYNKKMVSSYPSGGKKPWTWRPYSGSNPHTKHVHISVNASKSLYDSRDDWALPEELPKLQNGEATEPAPEAKPEPPQQNVEAGGVGVSVATEQKREPISKPNDEPAVVVAVEPQPTNKKRTLWATIMAAVAYIGLNIKDFFTNAYSAVESRPMAVVALVCGSVVILVFYWLYTERENRKAERRSQQAHELTLEKMRLAADPDRYSVSVIKAEDVPADKEAVIK